MLRLIRSSYFMYSVAFLAIGACQFKSKETDGTLVSGHIQVANKFTLSTPSNSSYYTGETINFVLTFPKAVTVSGTPSFDLTIGSTTRIAEYVSGDGTSDLIFSYTIQAADLDSDGIQVSSGMKLDPGEYLRYDSLYDCSNTIDVPNLSSVLINSP